MRNMRTHDTMVRNIAPPSPRAHPSRDFDWDRLQPSRPNPPPQYDDLDLFSHDYAQYRTNRSPTPMRGEIQPEFPDPSDSSGSGSSTARSPRTTSRGRSGTSQRRVISATAISGDHPRKSGAQAEQIRIGYPVETRRPDETIMDIESESIMSTTLVLGSDPEKGNQKKKVQEKTTKGSGSAKSWNSEKGIQPVEPEPLQLSDKRSVDRSPHSSGRSQHSSKSSSARQSKAGSHHSSTIAKSERSNGDLKFSAEGSQKGSASKHSSVAHEPEKLSEEGGDSHHSLEDEQQAGNETADEDIGIVDTPEESGEAGADSEEKTGNDEGEMADDFEQMAEDDAGDIEDESEQSPKDETPEDAEADDSVPNDDF
jgi:hypothetical protein